MNTLVERAQLGDAEAFISLMEECRMSFRRIAFGYLGNDEDAADAIQDTVLSAYEHIQELKNAAYFKTWITRILINHCKDLLKQNKRCTVSDEMIQTVEATQEDDREFYALIGELPEDYRMIFLLYYGEEFRTSEIAQILDVNENTVKTRLSRGRTKLKKIYCFE